MGIGCITKVLGVPKSYPFTRRDTAYVDFMPLIISCTYSNDLAEHVATKAMATLGQLKVRHVRVYVDARKAIPRKTALREARKQSCRINSDSQMLKLCEEDRQVVQRYIDSMDMEGFFRFECKVADKVQATKAFKNDPRVRAKLITDSLAICRDRMDPSRYEVLTVEGEDAEYALVRDMLADTDATVAVSSDNDTQSLLVFNSEPGREVCYMTNKDKFCIEVTQSKKMAIFFMYFVQKTDYFSGVSALGTDSYMSAITHLSDCPDLASGDDLFAQCRWFVANLLCFRYIDTEGLEAVPSARVEFYLKELYSYLSLKFDFGKCLELSLTKREVLQWARSACAPNPNPTPKNSFTVTRCVFDLFKSAAKFKCDRRTFGDDVSGRIDPWFLYRMSNHSCLRCREPLNAVSVS